MTCYQGKDCRRRWTAWLLFMAIWMVGCGQTRAQLATEQMLASDAVDRSVANLDLTPLTGKSVYFDTQFIRNVKGAGFVNADYIVSSLRQQMFAYGCRIQDSRDDAEVIIEGRVGVLGIDDHEITYGLPASNALNTAASAVTSAPVALPALPELSVAKKNEQVGAAKLALFAYDRETRTPLWQSGVTTSMSDSDAFWVFGAGPFRRGTIYEGMQFAGSKVRVPRLLKKRKHDRPVDHALVSYQEVVDFTESESDPEPEPEPEAAQPMPEDIPEPGSAADAPDALKLPAEPPATDTPAKQPQPPATATLSDEPKPARKPPRKK